MSMDLTPYPAMKDSGVEWLEDVPEHWKKERAKWLFRKMEQPVRQSDEVVTCFRDGVVTLRKNRRVRGFTESLKEIGYQGVRRGDLVIHAMDAFAGAIGVSDSDGKSTPSTPCVHRDSPRTPTTTPSVFGRWPEATGYSLLPQGLGSGLPTSGSTTSPHSGSHYHRFQNKPPSSAFSTTPVGASGATSAPSSG